MSLLKNFSNLLRSKKELIGCIFITLIIQMTVTFITMEIDQTHHIVGQLSLPIIILSVIFVLVFIFTIRSPSIPFYVKQILFAIFSIFNGLLLSQLIYYINDPQIVKGAGIATLISVGLMFIVGLFIVYLKYDLGWLGMILYFALICLIIAQVIIAISTKSNKNPRYISIISVIIFSLYIVYDTNNILLKYKNNDKIDCISGAVEYYLDIFNLFTSFMDIMDSKK